MTEENEREDNGFTPETIEFLNERSEMEEEMSYWQYEMNRNGDAR